MNIYDETIKNVKSLDYLAEWYESDVVSVGYEETKKNRETMTQSVIKTLERAKKVEELKDLFMQLANNNYLMYQTNNPIFVSKRTILLHEINGKEKELEEMK